MPKKKILADNAKSAIEDFSQALKKAQLQLEEVLKEDDEINYQIALGPLDVAVQDLMSKQGGLDVAIDKFRLYLKDYKKRKPIAAKFSSKFKKATLACEAAEAFKKNWQDELIAFYEAVDDLKAGI